MSEVIIDGRKPVYTINLDNVDMWHREFNSEGKLKAAKGGMDIKLSNGETLCVSLVKPDYVVSADGDIKADEAVVIVDVYLIDVNSSEYQPQDIIDRIDVDGYRRIRSGTFLVKSKPLSASEAAEEAGVTRQYINNEIASGRLPAKKVDRQYEIDRADFNVWMSNPKRGSRVEK